MARISLNQARGLPDIMSSSEYSFVIGAIPGGGTDRNMVIKCQSAEYPGMDNETMEVSVHGFKMYYRGTKRPQQTMTVTYLEDRTMDTLRQIETWMEFQAGTISGTSGGYKRDYAVDGAKLQLYDTTGLMVKELIFYGLQPQGKGSISLDNATTAAMVVSQTFVYDHYIPTDIGMM